MACCCSFPAPDSALGTGWQRHRYEWSNPDWGVKPRRSKPYPPLQCKLRAWQRCLYWGLAAKLGPGAQATMRHNFLSLLACLLLFLLPAYATLARGIQSILYSSPLACHTAKAHTSCYTSCAHHSRAPSCQRQLCGRPGLKSGLVLRCVWWAGGRALSCASQLFLCAVRLSGYAAWILREPLDAVASYVIRKISPNYHVDCTDCHNQNHKGRLGPKSGGGSNLCTKIHSLVALLCLPQIANTAATEVRVGGDTTQPPEVLSGTKSSRNGKTDPRATDRHRNIQKRSFRRARNRLAEKGITKYKGRIYYTGQLGQKGEAQVIQPQLNAPTRSSPETMLQRWLPEDSAPVAAPKHAQTLGILTLNLGGLSKSGYDELAQWLESPPVVAQLDMVFLQEHWRPAAEFCLPHWTWIQSKAAGRSGTCQHQGLAILVNKRLAPNSQGRYAEVVLRRVLRLLLPAVEGHPLRHRPHTAFCVYQHARSSESAETYAKRLKSGMP